MELQHWSHVSTLLPRGVVQEPSPGFKPQGLWLSVGDEWRRWCEWQDFYAGQYHFRVVVDTTHLLVLSTPDKLRVFNRRYGVQRFGVEWGRMAKLHRGILIAPYHQECRWEYLWYSTWDVASACIWDTAAITRVEKVDDCT